MASDPVDRLVEVAFRGFELSTPFGGIGLGSESIVSGGEHHFRGLVLNVPFGTIRAGFRSSQQAVVPNSPRDELAGRLRLAVRHVATAVVVLLALKVVDRQLQPGDYWFEWTLWIWGAIVVIHLFIVLGLPALDRLSGRVIGKIAACLMNHEQEPAEPTSEGDKHFEAEANKEKG